MQEASFEYLEKASEITLLEALDELELAVSQVVRLSFSKFVKSGKIFIVVLVVHDDAFMPRVVKSTLPQANY